MRKFLKTVFSAIALIIVWPSAATCWLEQRLRRRSEQAYLFWAHLFAMAPGLPGVYIRRAFYRLTLTACTHDFYIGFGSVFTHRAAIVETEVYIGSYALIGCAILRRGCLIGSRASLLSGGTLHDLDSNGNWTATNLDSMKQIEIGEHAWLGEGVIVMTSVGPRAMLSAGTVVSVPVPADVMVAGNPGRFVKRLHAADVADDSSAGKIDNKIGVEKRSTSPAALP